MPTPDLHHAVRQCNAKKLQSLLQERKTDVNASDDEGKTALHEAAANSGVQILSLLVEHRADVNQQVRAPRNSS